MLLSQNTDAVFPTREDWKWRRPQRTARSSLALMDSGTSSRLQRRCDGPSVPPNRRPRRRTRSPGRETPDGETPPEKGGASGATTADPEDSPETRESGLTYPPDPKTGGDTAVGTACGADLLGRDGTARTACPAARARYRREDRWRTEIRQPLIQAWRCVLAMEKPQKFGHLSPPLDTEQPERARGWISPG